MEEEETYYSFRVLVICASVIFKMICIEAQFQLISLFSIKMDGWFSSGVSKVEHRST